MKHLILIALTFALAGCGSLRDQAQTTVALDVATTYAIIKSGAGVEGNALINSPAGFAASVVGRVVGIEHANTLPEPKRTQTLAFVSAAGWGVNANNLFIIFAKKAAASVAMSVAGPLIGISVAWWMWHRTEPERMFAAICADERTRNPELICTFTPTS